MPIAQPMAEKKQAGYFRQLPFLKKLFWLYFFLLIFEGALRKWVLPQLSAPLLVVRDPVSLWIIWEAYRTHKWPQRWSAVMSLLTVLLVGLFTVQIIFGGNTFLVGLYGLRSYLLPFPVLFIMGENLDEEDLRKFGQCTLWLLPPMALLEVAQYMSPSSSFLNKGAYQGASQIGFVGEHIRAAGTFSFATGAIGFDMLAAAFIFYGMVKEGLAKHWWLWVCAFALILSVPMMGSRGLVYQLAGLLGCVALGSLLGIRQFANSLRILVPLSIVVFLVWQLPVFSDATSGLQERFAGGEGTALETPYIRMITPIINSIESSDMSSNGIGIGMGRSAIAVGAFLNGETVAQSGEDDFSRIIAEMGLGGMVYQLFRTLLAVIVLGKAVTRASDQVPLAMLMVPLAIPLLVFSSFENTISQGFTVIGMAFSLAAVKTPVDELDSESVNMLLRRQAPLRPRLYRG